MSSALFKEAKRLWKLGFAVHWLHPNSKRPIESGWTTGPRKDWSYLAETYIEGLNLGVRLGEASRLRINGAASYLAVVDVDVKSTDPAHRKEAVAAAKVALGSEAAARAPMVLSGRGNGSRHYYVVTAEPFKTWNPAASTDLVKVHMPSKKPSKKELAELTVKEIKEGLRIAPAWEISLYSTGRQVVLPPSLHPDSGKPYAWKKMVETVSDLPLVDFGQATVEKSASTTTHAVLEDFEVSPVELSWLPISNKMRDAITKGVDVTDRSAYLLPASNALLSAGLTQNEVLTVLTDPDTFLGACAYDHVKSGSRAQAAAWVYKYTLKRVASERSAVSAFSGVQPIEPIKILSDEEAEEQADEFLEGRKWWQDLERSGPKGEGPFKGSLRNVVLILQNSIAPDLVKRDAFAYRDAYSCKVPWADASALIGNDDVAQIKLWLANEWGFEPKKEVLEDALTNIACQNVFDPVRDQLQALPVWDGRSRLNDWLIKNFEAKGDAEYLAQVFRKWMCAMVMRAIEPGEKFDWMPIFEGAQGVGKSSFGRLLCGDKYFLDWLPNLGDKDAALALQGVWVVEMGELSQFRKNELDVIKSFLTRSKDKVRPPYGRRTIESARRCVFFGTTNNEQYLRDDSGNRRFKPVMVGRLNFKALERDRDQLFAEALHLYETGKETWRTLDLTGKALIYEAMIHKQKMVEDDSHAMFSQLQKSFENPTSDFTKKEFELIELFSGQGALSSWRYDNRNRQFAAKALKLMGAQKRDSNGHHYWKVANDENSARSMKTPALPKVTIKPSI